MSAQSDFSPAVLSKAKRVPFKDIRQHEADPSVWFVKSSRTKAEHRVQFIQNWITCTCQHGDVKVSTSRCYHSCAAYLVSRGEHPEQKRIEEQAHGAEN